VVAGEYTPEGGAAAMASMLTTRRRPTAVVAADANEGLGVWSTLHARGLSVPEDVSLIAIHKLPAEDFRVPAMSCVEMPLRGLGRRAAELVLDSAWDAPIREVISDDVRVWEGGTVAAPSD
jgi:LacI family transcriptional regulator